jgi:Uncharacterised MFS-type transporter YbfB
MNTEPLPSAHPDRETWLVLGSGIVALAVAMGIGRFAFTPLMPLMMRDGTLSAVGGAEWAAANYGGYLVGALTASWFSSNPRGGLMLGLLGVALTTMAAAWTQGESTAFVGAVLRAGAGVFSAWALVCISSWCLAELARRQTPQLGAWIYTGVGLGIALTGALVWLGGRQPANWLWLELGFIAAAGALFVSLSSPGQSTPSATAGARTSKTATSRAGRGTCSWCCYGTFGFGYIVPATFLPVMAQQLVRDPLVFGLTWPLFGLAATLSVAAAARWLPGWPRRRVWALSHGVMALGTVLPLVSQTLWALAASAVLVGGTFMVATMAGLQLAREQVPANPTRLLARMTAAFAAGQIAGPLLVRALGTGNWAGLDALGWASALATVLLMLTAAWLSRDVEPSHSTLRQLQ